MARIEKVQVTLTISGQEHSMSMKLTDEDRQWLKLDSNKAVKDAVNHLTEMLFLEPELSGIFPKTKHVEGRGDAKVPRP